MRCWTGARGSFAVSAAGEVHVASATIPVIDTVGTGDAYMSGLIDAMVTAGLVRTDGLLDAGEALRAVADGPAGVQAPRQRPGRHRGRVAPGRTRRHARSWGRCGSEGGRWACRVRSGGLLFM